MCLTSALFVRSGLSQTKSWEGEEFCFSLDELITVCSVLVMCWDIFSVLHTFWHGLNPACRSDQCFLHLFLSLPRQQELLPFTFSNKLVVGRIWWSVLGCHRRSRRPVCSWASCPLLPGMKKQAGWECPRDCSQALRSKLGYTNFQTGMQDGRVEAFCLPAQHHKKEETVSEIKRQ